MPLEDDIRSVLDDRIGDYRLKGSSLNISVSWEGDELNYWIDTMDILDKNPSNYIADECLKNVNENGTTYIEIGATYKEDGDIFRVTPEVYPFEPSNAVQQVNEMLDKLLGWERNDAERFEFSDE